MTAMKQPPNFKMDHVTMITQYGDGLSLSFQEELLTVDEWTQGHSIYWKNHAELLEEENQESYWIML